MRFVSKLALAAMLTAALSLINPAMAGCRRMGFTVNDYGLEGPKRDAQNLLDKHIAEWAAEQGIEKYNIGKKDVSCELYLNLVLFDEHTCTATTTVCWGDSINRNSSQSASTKKPAPIKKDVATKAKSSEAKEESASETKAAAAADEADSDAKDEAKTAETRPDQKSEETEAVEAETGDESEVETGTIPVPSTAAGTAAAVSPLTGNAAIADDDASETETAQSEGEDSSAASSAAAAAAEAAAAAAERAASAAERAAKAAERAAAALADVPRPSSSSASSTEPPSSGSGPSSPTASTSTSPNTGSPVAPAATSP